MLSFLSNAGYATVTVDFTNDMSSLLVGLIGLTALSAAMIVVEAVRYRLSQKTKPVTDTTPITIAYRHAA
jgi:hypothetical protein